MAKSRKNVGSVVVPEVVTVPEVTTPEVVVVPEVVVPTAKRVKRDTIALGDFLKVYLPMATEGKSAKEIGVALGRDATYVSVKACQLRKAISEGEGDEATKAARLAKVPTLKMGRGKGKSAMAELDAFGV